MSWTSSSSIALIRAWPDSVRVRIGWSLKIVGSGESVTMPGGTTPALRVVIH
jgi:hypothetical protein